MMKLPPKRPGQADVVGTFLGTVSLIRGELPDLSESDAAAVAARLVGYMDLNQPTFQVLHDKPLSDADLQRLREQADL